MKISILSVSCCNPAMRSEDQTYLAKVQEALAQSDVEAMVSIVTISEAFYSIGKDKVSALMPLWKKYGAALMPALLIDDELVLYGGIPTKEKIIEVISEYNSRSQLAKKKTEYMGKTHPEDERKVRGIK